LASLGSSGLFHAERPGIALPSENAHYAMFGYSHEEFPGRGYLEALGAGIKLEPNDVAVLAHFDHVVVKNGVLVLEKERPPASTEEISTLSKFIESYESEGVSFKYVPTYGCDGILILCGEVSPYITDSDPITEGETLIEPVPWKDFSNDSAAIKTAHVLKNYLLWCYKNLSQDPLNKAREKKNLPTLNAIATNRTGRFKQVEPFGERWGLRALSISAGVVYHGLAEHLGLDVIKVRDSDDPGKDLTERLEQALEKTGDYDFIHVHTKAPDVASHKKDPELKKKTIESLDSGLGEILDLLINRKDLLLAITADHSSPCTYPLVHSGEPVPITMFGESVRVDNVKKFDEIHCAGGALGFVRGADLMHVILNILDRVKLRGLMDTPVDQPYWPGHTLPLRIDREQEDDK
jgi:2,3-bisphosphoglycerate-independent phosphoglycerate mutase